MRIRSLTATTAMVAALALTGTGLATAAPAVSAPSPATFSVTPAAAPQLDSFANFRDVAGDGEIGGVELKPGVFYRSNAPRKTSEADLAALADLGITTAYDMRDQSEIDLPMIGGADILPAGTEYRHTPIEFANLIELIFQVPTKAEADEYMRETNRAFVTDADRRAGFAEVLQGLADGDDPQLFHCTSGKDRTGWVSYLLLSLVGVDNDAIIDDYLLSNDNLAADNAEILGIMGMTSGSTGSLGMADAGAVESLMTVDESYLRAGMEQLEADFDDVEDYLTSAAGLGLTEDTVDALRTKLVG